MEAPLEQPNNDKELTFEQQQEVDRLSNLANTPSSNQNKHRFNLYAYIEKLISEDRKAREAEIDRLARVDEVNNLQAKNFIVNQLYHGAGTIKLVTIIEVLNERLAELQPQGDKTHEST